MLLLDTHEESSPVLPRSWYALVRVQVHGMLLLSGTLYERRRVSQFAVPDRRLLGLFIHMHTHTCMEAR